MNLLPTGTPLEVFSQIFPKPGHLYKGILKEKPLSQVKNGGWSYKIYSLPERSFLLSEFGSVLTYVHKITKPCFLWAGTCPGGS